MDEGVMVLTEDNFNDEISNHPNILVEFYAPWCGHCKKLAPEYSAAAEVLSNLEPPIPLGKVDATVEKKLAEEFGVQGFPTLIYFKNGERVEYTGGRTKDAIVQWVTKKSGPPSTAVDCAALKEKIADNAFVMAFFGFDDEALYKDAHVPVADVEDKITFVHNDNPACAESYGVKHPSLVFFRKFETEQNPYTGPADKESLQNFYKPLMVAEFFKFTEDEIEAVFGQQQNTLILFRAKDDTDSKSTALVAEASKAFKGKILFAYSDKSADIQDKLMDFMGVTEDEFPTIRAIVPANMTKYKYETHQDFWKLEELGEWIDAVNGGSARPHLKSAEEPDMHVNEAGNVITIVGTTFDRYARHYHKDSFVKFYAPWCGHCKKLAPIWDELGAAFKEVDGLLIGKFDATANEAEHVNIRGYPTLLFYPAGVATGIPYEGERDLESMKKWLEENSDKVKEFRKGGAAAETPSEDEASKDEL